MNISVSQRNARVAISTNFIRNLAFVLPIWLIFGTEDLGYSTTATVILWMSIWLVSGLLEIPTGAIADRVGRKKAFLIGGALLSVYPIGYFLGLPLGVILLLNLISAVGSSISSGTVLPIVHNSYQSEKRSEKDYHSFLSNRLTALYIARAASGILGGIFYAIDPILPFIAMMAAYIISTAMGLLLVDKSALSDSKTNRLQITETITEMKKHRIIINVILSYIAIQLVGEAVWTAYQPLFVQDGLSPEQIGLLFTVIALLSALGSALVKKLMRSLSAIKIELLAGITVFITAMLLNFDSTTLHFIAIIPSAIMFGMTITPLEALTQKKLPEQYHSTGLSIISFAQYATYGLASVGVALVIDAVGIGSTRAYLLIGSIIAVAFSAIILAKNKRHDSVIIS